MNIIASARPNFAIDHREVREFLDSAGSEEEARQLAESSRQDDEDIDQLVELARADSEGRTTRRSIAEQVGIDRGVAWRALEVLRWAFGG